MAVSVTMPALGESVTEGTVTRWLKREGEQIEVDEPLLEVSTDKVDTEIPSPAAGVLQSIKVQEDETVEVGVELAVIGDGAAGGGDAPSADSAPEPEPEPEPAATDASPQPAAPQQEAAQPAAQEQAAPAPDPEPAAQQAAPQQAAPQQAAPQQAAPQQAAPAAQAAPQASGDGAEVPYVTPLVRKMAADHGVDLSSVQATGVGGRIRKQDVLDAAQAAPSAQTASSGQAAPSAASTQGAPEQAAQAPDPQIPVPAQGASAPAPAYLSQAVQAASKTNVRGRTEELSRLRRVIADRVVESLQTSAQVTTVVEVDVTRVARLRDAVRSAFEAQETAKLSFLPFFAVATVEALKAHPQLNASLDQAQGTVTYHDAQHLGVAVDTERGLLVPVLHDAGDLNVAGMARKIADLAARTRRNEVTPEELGGGTFTITNTGSRGALFDTPVINQPQVGILGTGEVVKRPVVVEHPDLGEVVAVRSMVHLALTYDHRIVDGADVGRFLQTIKARLEQGDFAAQFLGR